MLACRSLIVAATIASASVVLADVLVQPGYEHQTKNLPHLQHHHTVPQYRVSPSTEYYAKESMNAQPIYPYLTGVRTTYPYVQTYPDMYSHMLGYPTYRSHSNIHLTKLGGHKYVHPSTFIRYHRPAAHYRYRRSTDSDETNKHAAVTLATKPSLMDTKDLTVIDSSLPEKESININDKKVKRNDNAAAGPLLFGLYPEKSEHRQLDSIPIKIKYPPLTVYPTSISGHLNDQSTTNAAKTIVTEPTKQTIPAASQEKNQEGHINHKDPHYSILSQPTFVVTKEISNKESASHAASRDGYGAQYRNAYEQPIYSMPFPWNFPFYYPIYQRTEQRNFPDSRPIYLSYTPKPSLAQDTHQTFDKKPSQTLRSKYNDESLSSNNQLIGAPNPSEADESNKARTPYLSPYPNYYASPYDYHIPPLYEDYNNPYLNDPYLNDPYYAIDPTSGIPYNPVLDTVQTSPHVHTMQQFSSTYNYPVKTDYFGLSHTYG